MCLVVYSTAYSQSPVPTDSTYKNALKVNLAAFTFSNLSMLYERQVGEHVSLQLGGGFKWGGNIPKAVGLGNFIVSSNSTGLKGYSFTPEARYYFSKCECTHTMQGLYAGLYSRLTRLSSDLDFYFWNGNQYIDFRGSGSFRELGLGIQMGYQFTIKKRILIDLMFMGPRTSVHKLKLNLSSDYVEEVIPLIEEELNERLGWFGIDPVDIPDSVNPEVRFGFSYFRYGISLGYLF